MARRCFFVKNRNKYLMDVMNLFCLNLCKKAEIRQFTNFLEKFIVTILTAKTFQVLCIVNTVL